MGPGRGVLLGSQGPSGPAEVKASAICRKGPTEDCCAVRRPARGGAAPARAQLPVAFTPGLVSAARRESTRSRRPSSCRGARHTQKRSREANGLSSLSTYPASSSEAPLAEPWGSGQLRKPQNAKSQSHRRPREMTKRGVWAGFPVCQVQLQLPRAEWWGLAKAHLCGVCVPSLRAGSPGIPGAVPGTPVCGEWVADPWGNAPHHPILTREDSSLQKPRGQQEQDPGFQSGRVEKSTGPSPSPGPPAPPLRRAGTVSLILLRRGKGVALMPPF